MYYENKQHLILKKKCSISKSIMRDLYTWKLKKKKRHFSLHSLFKRTFTIYWIKLETSQFPKAINFPPNKLQFYKLCLPDTRWQRWQEGGRKFREIFRYFLIFSLVCMIRLFYNFYLISLHFYHNGIFFHPYMETIHFRCIDFM
jgi:hypothetical protein